MPNSESAAATLRPNVSGAVLLPDAAGYDAARRVHNGLIDRRPAIIVQCRGTADAQAAVRAAREHGFEIAVRGGGHNVAGNAMCDGGVVIDLSQMRAVQVDPKARRVRAQGGTTWGDYNRETQLHGLATTGGVVSTTGIGGLTLGGGLGWLMGSHGLAVDNLRSATLVNAAGEVVQASDDDSPDLFWAIRGGGGNFGVATWLEYDAHPVGPIVTGGLVAHPFSAARDVLRFYRDVTATLPDEFTIFAGLIHAPDGSGAKLAAIFVCHIGDLDAGARAVEPIKRFGTPVMDVIGPMPYSVVNTLFDAGFPAYALNYWKANFLSGVERRRHRHDDRALRRVSVADERASARAFPRGRDPGGANGNGVSASDARLQHAGGRRVDGPGTDGGQHGLDPRDVCGDVGALRRRAVRQLSQRR